MLAVANIKWDGLEPFKTKEREDEYRGWMNGSVQVIVKKVLKDAKGKAEEEILNKLDHQNVIKLLSAIQKDGSRYINFFF